MKKLLFLLIVICLLLASCDEILPSGEPEEEQHVHTWNAGYYTVVPTCQTDGERVYTCTTCNETKTEVVKASEQFHEFGNGEEKKAATCTQKGERLFTCALCNATKTIETDALGHIWDEGKITKEATAEENGEITYSCTREGCDATRTESYHLHLWGSGEVNVPATCTTDGEMVYTCSVCNETKTEPIPADGTTHTYDTEWQADETQHWHAATCEHEVTSVKENHDWGETEVIKEGSCTEDGEEKTTCKVCGYSVTEVIPKETLHDYDTGNNTCKSCGDVCYFQAQYTQNKVFVTLRAAYYNSGLTDLVIPEYVPNYNYSRWYRAEVIKSVPASTLESLVIPEGVTTIGYQAFKGHANLKTVVLPSTLTTIEQEAFMECTALESLTIPASVTFIGSQALAYCTSLKDIYYDGTSDEWLALLSTGTLILYNSNSAIVYFSKY